MKQAMRLLWSSAPQAAGRANQIASVSVSISKGQLHQRNRPQIIFAPRFSQQPLNQGQEREADTQQPDNPY